MTTPLVAEAQGLKRHYTVRRGLFRAATVKAVDGVSFRLAAGRTLAVVGESGCGKSTLGRLVAMVELPTEGRLLLDGGEPAKASRAARRRLRRAVQMVFQDPYGSLNPRRTVAAIVEEPLRIAGGLGAGERRERVAEMLALVGLRPEQARRYPHMFSGGQRQRIAIARALVADPRLVVADEPVSALDVSIQAQILNLLYELQRRLGLAYLFISHNLAVVRHIADEVMVMYLGRPVETGSREAVLSTPLHPYTRALLAAAPTLERRPQVAPVHVAGEPPSPFSPPVGCAFHARCPFAVERCRVEPPPPRRLGDREVACHRAEELG